MRLGIRGADLRRRSGRTTSAAVPSVERAEWRESFLGGSPDAEQALIARFVDEIRVVQQRNAQRESRAAVRRGFHAKLHAGITDAELRIREDLAPDLQNALFVPRTVYRALVRFSNAAGTVQPDTTRDLRGIAIRVVTEQDARQDFLLTNAPASHARDAHQFMATAKAFATPPTVLAPVRLALEIGPGEAIRVLGSLRRATARKVASLATESYWSRAPFALGANAVKFVLRPLSRAPRPVASGSDYLSADLADRLRERPVRFELAAQRYVDDRRTPLEDGSVEWDEGDAPSEPVAELFIPAQELASSHARAQATLVEELAFSPWNDGGHLRPLGSLNRARKAVYEASAEHRGAGET